MIGIESQCFSCVHLAADVPGSDRVPDPAAGPAAHAVGDTEPDAEPGTESRHELRTETAVGPTCAAFPSGIPEGMLANRVDHRLPYPGDGGVRWTSDGTPFPERSFEIMSRLV